MSQIIKMPVYFTKMSLDDLEFFLSKNYPGRDFSPVYESCMSDENGTTFLLYPDLEPLPEFKSFSFQLQKFHFDQREETRVNYLIRNISEIFGKDSIKRKDSLLIFSDPEIGGFFRLNLDYFFS